MDADNFNAWTSGAMSGLSGLSPGDYYFVSDATPGLLSISAPVALTSFQNPILFAVSGTEGIVLEERPSAIALGVPQTGYTGYSGTMTTLTRLWQSNTSGGSAPSYSDANTSPHYDQYTSGETYAYSPVASANSTVGAGTNEYSGYCAALSTAGLTAAATACESDTTYACTYNTSNHTVTCPTRTVNARPASGAWDVGAYEFTGGSTPSPPTNVQMIAH